MTSVFGKTIPIEDNYSVARLPVKVADERILENIVS
jgi:hypothetical protein